MWENIKGLLALPEDPTQRAAAKQGLLTAGAALLGGRGDLGGILGDSLMAGTQGYHGALAQQQQQALRQAQMQQIGLENQKLSTAIAKPGQIAAAMARARQPSAPAQAEPTQVSSILPMNQLPRLGHPAAPAQAASNAPAQPTSPQDWFNFYRQNGDALAADGLMDEAKQQYDLAEKLRPKLMKQEARVVDGRRVMANIYEDGRTEQVEGFAPDLEKLVFADNGGTYNGRDAYTGEVKSTSTNTLSPSERANIEQRERERKSAEARAWADRSPKPPVGYRWAADGKSLEPIPGGPVTAKTTEVQQKIGDAQSVLGLLDMAEPLVSKATSSYGGMAVDQAARLFGASTDGGEAAAQLKAIEGSLISKMPKMSGPQSDKDVLLYRQMAGQVGDPTVPASNKLAAMKVIREINQRYLEQVQPQQVKSVKDLPKKAPPAVGAPAVGTVKGGYRFKGGNPAVQTNWEKV